MAHSRYPKQHTARLSDAQIAHEAARRLAWDTAVPIHRVTVEVRDGRLTLSGELQRDAQKIAVLEDVTRLFGVARVCDRLVVRRA
ncbi:MAG TPA: BON domain-containing protein [Paraburkholderia sp.]|uniref:BON domain-containing protein n=1 Tax=Paraburkholderia sp. TaxID=1926495 RepID=UPI002ED10A07